ncbi:hypothetical protein GCM10010988_25440 [Cnuibacter physcomitrellae]|uniref:Uncharacterized protein n=1 Tax=Cnuibacter physcomitrellae TaxID=1619308 RepID=A0A1X9LFG3_9MICO|nr:hypothetical protein [Cnuibacter physcomitrellae]ARJ03877.1 hypothetical protein B5808_00480 [Cnuibacter physcomitrellae]GGI39712.1 hypothetical protein GCM10010988_25440 [Cnuibacter physcomitrellae]
MTAKQYEIRLPHALSDILAEAFPEMDAVAVGPSSTLLIGPVQDQSELHGLLARIADMGMEIQEVRQQP